MHRVIYDAARTQKESGNRGGRGGGENRGSAWRSVARVINLNNLEIIVGADRRDRFCSSIILSRYICASIERF